MRVNKHFCNYVCVCVYTVFSQFNRNASAVVFALFLSMKKLNVSAGRQFHFSNEGLQLQYSSSLFTVRGACFALTALSGPASETLVHIVQIIYMNTYLLSFYSPCISNTFLLGFCLFNALPSSFHPLFLPLLHPSTAR